ncbi:hypothetical protein SCALM49S_02772 [Streptomyces californicus]
MIVRPVRFVPSKPGATSEVVVRRARRRGGVRVDEFRQRCRTEDATGSTGWRRGRRRRGNFGHHRRGQGARAGVHTRPPHEEHRRCRPHGRRRWGRAGSCDSRSADAECAQGGHGAGGPVGVGVRSRIVRRDEHMAGAGRRSWPGWAGSRRRWARRKTSSGATSSAHPRSSIPCGWHRQPLRQDVTGTSRDTHLPRCHQRGSVIAPEGLRGVAEDGRPLRRTEGRLCDARDERPGERQLAGRRLRFPPDVLPGDFLRIRGGREGSTRRRRAPGGGARRVGPITEGREGPRRRCRSGLPKAALGAGWTWRGKTYKLCPVSAARTPGAWAATATPRAPRPTGRGSRAPGQAPGARSGLDMQMLLSYSR